MRISFDDGGYLEFQRSKKAQHVHVLIAAKKSDNHLELLINSAEVPLAKLIEAVKSVSGSIIIKKENENEDIKDKNPISSKDS